MGGGEIRFVPTRSITVSSLRSGFITAPGTQGLNTAPMDIERIKSLAEAKEDENWRFRVYLKGLDLPGADLDRLVWRHLEDVTRRIDCCSCANCCTVISPLLSHKDVRRLAGHVGIEETQLIGTFSGVCP